MTVTRDANGFSVFGASANTVIWYVAANGSDSTADGTNINTPYLTLTAALARAKTYQDSNGIHPNWILLREGDVFDAETDPHLRVSGLSADEPFLISSYAAGNAGVANPATGGARPIIRSSPTTSAAGMAYSLYANFADVTDHIAVAGIDFHDSLRDPNHANYSSFYDNSTHIGIFFGGDFSTGTSFLIEDCKFHFYAEGVLIQPITGSSTNVKIRRCVFVDQFCTTGNDAKGLGLFSVSGEMEDCVFDHNGWDYGGVVTEAQMAFFHNYYFNNGPIHITNCISMRDAGGSKPQGAGNMTNNLFARSGLFCAAYGWDLTNSNDYTVSDNVFIEARETPLSGRERGFGLINHPDWANGGHVTVTRNVFAHWEVGNGYGVHFGEVPYYQTGHTVSDNIFRAVPVALDDQSNAVAAGNIFSANNKVDLNADSIDDNTSTDYSATWTFPNRSIASYTQDVLGVASGTYEDFLALARLQRKGNYDRLLEAESVNDYIREGFGADFVGSAYADSVSSPLSISPTTLANGTVGTAYSETVVASGGTSPYTYSVSVGSLPSGLSLDSGTGDITGTPTTAGDYSFTIHVVDDVAATADRAYSVTIAAVVSLSPATLGAGIVGLEYSQTVTASGGTAPYTFSIVSGALPTGLAIGSTTGTISGAPTVSGSFTFTVRATDANVDVGDLAYSVTISNPNVSDGISKGQGRGKKKNLLGLMIDYLKQKMNSLLGRSSS